MNRYIIQGILQDLTNGRDVLVVTPDLATAQRAHQAVLDHVIAAGTAADHNWSKANGHTWIRHADAAATFVPLQGMAADHADADVVVVNGYRTMTTGPKVWGGTGRNDTAIARIRDLTDQRDTVLID